MALELPAKLPTKVRQKLSRTLSQWTSWQCNPTLECKPEVLHPLGDGQSNFSLLAASGPHHFVIRIDGVNPGTNGLNRQCEWRILADAWKAGLAPAARYFNPELGSLVCDYLPADEAQQESMQDLAALLRDIHHLPSRHHRLDLAERIRRYEKHLEHLTTALHEPLLDQGRRVSDLLDTLVPGNEATVLCHNDLLRANRFYHEGRLIAVDWEYAAMGSPWYELAVIIQGDGLGDADSRALLEAYLDRPATAELQARLLAHGCVYRYLELLWYRCQRRQILPEEALNKKLSVLASALQDAAD